MGKPQTQLLNGATQLRSNNASPTVLLQYPLGEWKGSIFFENKLLIGSTILLFELGGLAGIRYLGVLYSQPVLALTESAPNEDSAKYFVNQGVDKAKTGDYRGAIEDLNQAIKLNPNFAAYYNRGLVRSYLGNKLAALEDLNQAIKLNPDFPPAYNNRGVLRSYLGNKLAALEDLNQAIKLNINDNDVRIQVMGKWLKSFSRKGLSENPSGSNFQ